MFGIQIKNDGPFHVIYDNESVMKNSTNIKYSKNKKNSSLSYNYVRWDFAACIVNIYWINIIINFANDLSKQKGDSS